MSRRRDPGWRDRQAADLLIRALPGFSLVGPTLLVGEFQKVVPEAMSSLGLEPEVWNRRAIAGARATSWPSDCPYAAAALRLPRAKDELALSLHAATSRLPEAAPLLVYGCKDEGIRSAVGQMEGLFDGVRTVAVGGRCRVLMGFRRPQLPGLRGTLESWKSRLSLEYPGFPASWVSYPGLFAHGRLDSGTRLLLDSLPAFPTGARVLDFGCGSGPIGHVARARGQEVRVELLDVDALALEAAGENVPGGDLRLSDGLPARQAGPYDAIVSNPPFHRGKREDPGMLTSLIEGASILLEPEGFLAFVTQRRLPVEIVLRRYFKEVRVLAQDSTYRVWMGGTVQNQEGM